MPPPRAFATLACLLGVLAASCTSATTPPPVHTAAPLPGDLLSVTSDQTATSIVRYRPADASSATIESPIDPEAVNRSTIAGVATAEGTLFVSANSRETQAYSLPTGSDQVEPLGPALDVRADQEPSVQISEAGAVVATCDDVEVLPLPAADRWRSFGPSCWAALDPTGSRVAVVRRRTRPAAQARGPGDARRSCSTCPTSRRRSAPTRRPRWSARRRGGRRASRSS